MLVAQERRVQYIFLGGINVTEIVSFEGYKIFSNPDGMGIFSPWKCEDKLVFAADSDYTTMAISIVKYYLKNNENCCISEVDERINSEILSIATDITLDENSDLRLICHDDACLFLASKKFELPQDLNPQEIEITNHEMIQNAWQDELNPLNISQGAYVSAQQYEESITHRLKLSAQSEENTIWPPRQLDNTGAIIGEPNSNLAPRGEVVSWTKLSAAGAPSEFSIRSPILGGITTVLIEFSEGPKGVFLLADDEVNEPKIGDFVNLVVRRIYAQEGIMRYGTKAILQD